MENEMQKIVDAVVEIISNFEKQFFKEKVIDHNVILDGEHDKRLAAELIQSGLLFNPETDIRPKFKVGQEVWINFVGTVWKSTIRTIVIDRSCIYTQYKLKEDARGQSCAVLFNDGQHIFATEAEARGKIL